MATSATVAAGTSRLSERVWLTLREATTILRGHANTLRRRARRTSICSHWTIGGHRRLSAPIRDLAATARIAAAIDRVEADDHEWSDSLADAFVRGLAESADSVRVRGGNRRGCPVAHDSRRGPPL